MLALTLALAAQATAPLPLTPDPLPAAVRNAGTYHVATGTWTRTRRQANRLGTDVLYDNTAPSGYFSCVGSVGTIADGEHITDHGGIPGTTNGDHAHPGIVDAYEVNGFEIGYCDTAGPGGGEFRIRFYEGFHSCLQPTDPPLATFHLSGLPAASGCWVVTVDLEGTGDEFCIVPDGGRLAYGWDDDLDEDTFSWSFESLSGATAGFLIAGDPERTDPNYVYTSTGMPARAATGTFFGSTSQCAMPGATNGTGYMTTDYMYIPTAGCRFFGGYRNRNGCGGPSSRPYASFHMKLFTRAGEVCDGYSLGRTYCTSNPNSTGAVGTLVLQGSPFPGADDFDLVAGSLPSGAFGLFLTAQSQGFTATPPGSEGNLCLGMNIGRFVAPGQVQQSDAMGTMRLSTSIGQWSLSSIPRSNGSYSAAAGGTSNFQLWYRDQVGGAATSNFTDAQTIVWQ